MCISLLITPRAPASSVARDSAYEGANLIDTLTDLGVPYDDAHLCGRGPSAAHSWWSRVAMTGLSVAWRSSRRLHPVDIHERTAQWRQEGWTGYDANAIRSTPAQARLPRRVEPRSRRAPRRVWRTRARAPGASRARRRSRFLWWKKTSP